MQLQYKRIAFVGIAIVSTVHAAHGASNAVTYQGVLVDATGAPVADGTYAMTFAIWDVPTGGTSPLWSEAEANVQVSNGVFAAVLGDDASFGFLFANNPSLYLEVRADLGGGEQVYMPRVPIAAAPYAFDSFTLNGLTASQIMASVENEFTGEAGGSTIGGGAQNSATGGFSTISGGVENSAEGPTTVIGGGQRNTATGISASIAGGEDHVASGNASTVAGGDNNQATGLISTVAGGANNVASGWGATVGGGQANEAAGLFSTVPGGFVNEAKGDYSFAAGFNTTAQEGAFCWGDSTGNPINAQTNGFVARATGGVVFTTDPNATGAAYLAPGSSTWTSLSDRNVKERIESVDPADVLEKVEGLPISEWSYKTQDGVRHMGPMAQDFHAAFGLGVDDKGITSLDGMGVALAAIQGLNAKVEERDARIAELEAKVARVDELERRLQEVTALLERMQSSR